MAIQKLDILHWLYRDIFMASPQANPDRYLNDSICHSDWSIQCCDVALEKRTVSLVQL